MSALLFGAWILITVLAAADNIVTYSAQLGDTTRVGTAEIVQTTQGESYVSLAGLVGQFGGSSRINSDRIEIGISGKTAWVGNGATEINSSLSSFKVSHPIFTQNRDVWISTKDVASFFDQAFLVKVQSNLPEQPSTTQSQPETPKEPEESLSTLPVIPESAPAEDETKLEDLPPLDKVPPEQPAQTPPPATSPPPAQGNAASQPGANTQSQPLPAPSAPPATLQSITQLNKTINVIIVDAGHGAGDVGCEQGEIKEKDISLAIALRLQKALIEQTGLKVLLTRDKDVDMNIKDRAAFATKNNGTLLISLHTGGGFSNKASGCELFSTANIPVHKGATADGIAYAVQSAAIAASIGNAFSTANGIGFRGCHVAPSRLLKEVPMPGLLVEVGCMINPAEAKQMQGEPYAAEISRCIATGVQQYLQSPAKGKTE